MSNMNHHKFFALPKSVLAILLVSNVIFAWWLNQKIGSYWGWTVVDLSADLSFNLATLLAVIQFALFGLSIDMTIRTFVTSINSKLKEFQVPAIMVMAMTIATYGIIGLLGFILLYDHSLSHILAAAGAVGLGAAYAFREPIADITASMQIQTDHLASINDYIEIVGEKDVYRVTQIDHRMITLEDKYHFLLRIPTRQFLNWKYINITKQPSKRGAKRRCTFTLTTHNNSNRVLSMMNNGMQYLVNKDERFYAGYSCELEAVTGGAFTYGISYECDPSLNHYGSSHLVNEAMLHIFNAAAININSDIAIYKYIPIATDAMHRLLDIYRSSILKVLDDNQMQELSANVNLVRFEAGDHVIKLGEHAQSMYFISEGHLEVGIPGKEGKELIVATLWPGDCVGEMSLLTGEPRSANVYAKSSGVLLEITKESLAPFFEASPQLIEKISQVLADRKSKNEKAGSLEEDPDSRLNRVKALAQKIFKFFFSTD
ncbi:cyclic nucleotide-binding domain-containing protein [Polynucleobacter alcilacus]|uniref:cyclic nucleotide-binding domain-containing protein n=1 Tax=Polynucleobacter alcilacus TaxID=1819739 RepID=UPI001C0B0FAE|nr:cyclic nucleotide-binding domain-containing protein [Polynucleobacter alcilacus]MBU3567367.1 mechanosensitive ion channel family protein [Polynucleobacter alcilacus]